MTRKVYSIENLDCANCAAAVERRIAAMPEVAEASLTFASKQLRITAEDPDAILDRVIAVAKKEEPDVEIFRRDDKRHSAAPAGQHTHAHDDDCRKPHAHAHDDDCREPHAHAYDDDCREPHTHHSGTVHYHTASAPGKAARSADGASEAKGDASCAACAACAALSGTVAMDTPAAAPGKKKSPSNAENDSSRDAPDKKKSRFSGKQKREILGMAIGAAGLAAGLVLDHMGLGLPSLIVCIAAYLLLGHKVLLSAGRGIMRGKVFDENFLMTIATLGAFALRDFEEAVGIMLFYRVGEFVEELAVARSRSQIMEAVDLRPEQVTLIEAGGRRVIPAKEARPGDIYEIRPGERVPLDGVVLTGTSRIDTAPITGEPVPVSVSAGDKLTSGCVNTSGLLRVRAEKALEESMVTKILDSVENAAANKPQLERFITRFSRFYTPAVVAIAVLTAVVPSLITGDVRQWVTTALTFLVISCPCALVLSVPLAFFSGIGAGSKRGILFKGGISLEALGKVRTVIMDKTGTLTKGVFHVQEVVPANGYTADEVLTLAASAETGSTHPIAASIKSAAKEMNLVTETPLLAEEAAGFGLRAKLSAGTVQIGSRRLLTGSGVSVTDTSADAGTEVYVAKDGVYIGRIRIDDSLKEDAKAAVTRLAALSKRTVMLTGDKEESARQIAKEVGVDAYHAHLLPTDKLEKLQELRRADGAVMFVGDGINDAPVLAGADVGAAMGSGADAAIEAADVVFMNSRAEAIPQSLTIANYTLSIARQNVVFALAVKFIVMILGYLGFANLWLAVFADTGVALLCVLNSIRVLYKK